jgi:hypothetical protein
VGYLCNFQKIAQSEQSPIGRNFAQSGHPDEYGPWVLRFVYTWILRFVGTWVLRFVLCSEILNLGMKFCAWV